MAKWRRATHAAGPSLEWQPIKRKDALAAIRVFGGVRVPPPGRETSVGSDQNYRYFVVNRSGKLELQRRERIGFAGNPGGHQLRFDDYVLREDEKKKSPPHHSFYQLTLEDVLSPDFGREQLYVQDQQGFMAKVRRNGQVKTWKRDPSRVSIPLKFGMYEAFRVEDPSELFVMASDFPINVDPTPAEMRDVVGRLTRGRNPSVRQLSAYNSYEALDRFLGNRDERKIANNTTVVRLDDIDSAGTRWAIAVILHNTKIITFYEGGGFTLNSGGYRTVTTKQRIRQFLPSGWELDRNWTLHGRSEASGGNVDAEFYDGISFASHGGMPPRQENPRKRVPRFDPDQLFVDVWEERDRLHIALFGWDGPYRERMTGDGVEIGDWWDDDARQMIEDGFFASHGRFDKNAVKEYAYEVGLVKHHQYGT